MQRDLTLGMLAPAQQFIKWISLIKLRHVAFPQFLTIFFTTKELQLFNKLYLCIFKEHFDFEANLFT